jgi:hypothetical protein
MPAAFFIALEKPIRGLKADARFPAFTAVSHKLEALAEKTGIESHMHFFDSPEESDALLEGLEIEDDSPSSYTWYSAGDGLQTINTLLGHVQKSAKKIANGATVIEEMHEMERILSIASQKNVGWCLTVDLDWND